MQDDASAGTDSLPVPNHWLIAGGIGSAIVAILHLVIIVVGPSAYRYFGAPELAPMAENGSILPALLTFAIAAAFAILSAYAFSGAGWIRPLPFAKVILVAAGFVYVLRGVVLVAEIYLIIRGKHPAPRMAAFSLSSLILGVAYLLGAVTMGSASSKDSPE